MNRIHRSAITCLFVLILSAYALASESCSLLGGICREACGQSERAEAGAFDDCGARQECCVAHEAAQDRVRCCIRSFDAKNYGLQNCSAPDNNACPNGSGSPVPCSRLALCREKQ